MKKKYLHRNYIVLICFLFGCGWIIGSDILMDNYLDIASILTSVQVIKGMTYVTVASAGLYGLLYLRDQELQQSQKYASTILETANVGISVIDEQGKIIRVNKAYANILGYHKEELVGTSILRLLPERKHSGISKIISDLTQDAGEYSGEWTLLDHENNEIPVLINSNALTTPSGTTFLVNSIADISKQKEYEQKLENSVKEKEVLLTEIHHRVKNNLAVVSSLMQLQAFETNSEEVKSKLSKSISRIETMASIHEILYKSESFSELQLGENLRELTINVIETFQVNTDIKFDFDIDPVTLSINQAVPCLLIVNEVLTNIIKHAYQQNDRGLINLQLKKQQETITLTITDDGRGLPEDFDDKPRNGSIGQELISSLATQLDADFEYQSPKQGAIFTLSFERSNAKGAGASNLR